MKEKWIDKFREIFHEEPLAKVFFAPGRVNLIGEHTDYNGGHVFPCALNMGTYGVVRPREDRTLRFYSLNFPEAEILTTTLDELTPERTDAWTSYPEGVIWAFGREGYSLTQGFDLLVYGDIPAGSGLSSSASLEVLTGIILRELGNFSVSMEKIALLGQLAENRYNGMSCGIMDQFASAMGKRDHAIFLDTNTLQYKHVPVQLGKYSLIITNSNVKHSLVDSAYNERRRQCEKGLNILQNSLNIDSLGDLSVEQYHKYKLLISDLVIRQRVHHAISENQRTIEAVNILEANDLEEFGKRMNASHFSLRDDYEVSCPEVDLLVETAQELPYVLGSRITGGGFGGCTISLVETSYVDSFKDILTKTYQQHFNRKPDFYDAVIGDGAKIIFE